MRRRKELSERVFLFVLILFLLQIFLLPVGLGVTYATKSTRPEHILRYENRRLRWDSATAVLADGTARLTLFDPEYDRVRSENGDSLIAPGTEKSIVVRLQNSSAGAVDFTAVLYVLEGEDLPVTATLTGEGLREAESFSLPAGAENAAVLRAVSGRLAGERLSELELGWRWRFDGEDGADTALGDGAGETAPLRLGLFVTVADENGTVTPDSPETGDALPWRIYWSLLAISGATLILLTVERKKHGQKNSENRSARF